MWIYIYKCWREFTSIGTVHVVPSSTASLSMPTAVWQIWLKYLHVWIRQKDHWPLSGVVHRLLQQKLLSYRALCSITDAFALYTACTGGSIVYHILCWLFLNLFEVHRRSFSHCSVKVVYCIVCSSGRIDCSTGNKILNLFLVTSKILMSTELHALSSLCALVHV